MRRADTWVKAGVAVATAAVAGWLLTTVALSFAARPAGAEDLTAAWQAAGIGPLVSAVGLARAGRRGRRAGGGRPHPPLRAAHTRKKL